MADDKTLAARVQDIMEMLKNDQEQLQVALQLQHDRLLEGLRELQEALTSTHESHETSGETDTSPNGAEAQKITDNTESHATDPKIGESDERANDPNIGASHSKTQKKRKADKDPPQENRAAKRTAFTQTKLSDYGFA